MFPLIKPDSRTLSVSNADEKSEETNILIDTSNKTISSSSISIASIRDINTDSATSLRVKNICLKQLQLKEKLNHIEKTVLTSDVIDDFKKQFGTFLTDVTNSEEFPELNLKIFRTYLWYFCSELYNWKSLAHSIYHLEHLIHHLDNHQIKGFIEKPFQFFLDDFILFMNDLITLQMKLQNQEEEHKHVESSKMNDIYMSTNLPTTFSEFNARSQIEPHISNLKIQINKLKELILTAKERFHMCQTDTNALQILLQAVDNINFDDKVFNKQDQENIRLLALKQDLSQKTNRTDLIQFKVYIDNQVKKLIELNKQNAKELERIKLLKSATCEARHIQTLLSIKPSSSSPPLLKKQNRISPYQSSRPYITFELEHIRQYQRQALLKSPYGIIPLYRRQAWAAANLFQDHPLHLLRYMQNSLRMQIHHLLGYDPSDMCSIKKKKRIIRSSNIEIFNTSQDVALVGNNKKLYRGRIDLCEVIPTKNSKEKKFKRKTNINENNENTKINFDQFDPMNKTAADDYLLKYLDWQTHFNEQDLPDELCKELFHHWKTVLCKDQPCNCHSMIKCEENDLIDIPNDSSPSSSPSSNGSYDDQCICSSCSCDCEKYSRDESVCLSSQSSYKCLKQLSNENQDILEDPGAQTAPDNQPDHSTNELDIKPTDYLLTREHENDEIIISDCFLNRVDRWTEQFGLFQNTYQSVSPPEHNTVSSLTTTASIVSSLSSSLELDDPTVSRQQILDHYRQRTQHN